jgi:hypothetical protein
MGIGISAGRGNWHTVGIPSVGIEMVNHQFKDDGGLFFIQ